MVSAEVDAVERWKMLETVRVTAAKSWTGKRSQQMALMDALLLENQPWLWGPSIYNYFNCYCCSHCHCRCHYCYYCYYCVVCVPLSWSWHLITPWTSPCSFIGKILEEVCHCLLPRAEIEWLTPDNPSGLISKTGLVFPVQLYAKQTHRCA